MKRKLALVIELLIVATVMNTACSVFNSGDAPSDGFTTAPIQSTVDFELNVNVDEGKDANGFTWENNYNEITITGYIGADDKLTVPEKINEKPVTKIAEGALAGFTGLKSIVIPGSVKSIVGVFKDCTGLETVHIASAGLEDMTGAFENCTSLQTVNIPTTVTSMNGAFRNCAMLKSAVVPESVTNLNNAFYGCSGLKTVVLNAKATQMDRTFFGCAALESVVIPATVTDLHETFTGCKNLVNVTIPDGVTAITGAFIGCAALRQITIPASVTSLYRAFQNCISLTEVVFADYDQYVESTYNAFDGCMALQKLELPMDSTFSGYGCISLEELTLRTSESYYFASDISFGNMPALKKVAVLSDAEDFTLETYTTREDSYTWFRGEEYDWYHSMLEDAKWAIESGFGYRYYDETLDDGTACRRLLGVYDSKAWSAELIPVEIRESNDQIDHQLIYSCYAPALFGNDLTPGVLLYTSVQSAFLECYRPQAQEEICGTEVYADCEYSKTVELNGISYPLEVFVNSNEE